MSHLNTATPEVGRHRDDHWPAFRTQETEPGGDAPDVNRVPDRDLPDFGTEVPDVARDSGAPPFTGEDIEDTGKPNRRKRPHDEPDI